MKEALLDLFDPGMLGISMDKTIRRYTSLDDMKRDEYREWQKLTPMERLDAGAELSIEAYRLKNPHAPERVEGTLIRLQRPERNEDQA